MPKQKIVIANWKMNLDIGQSVKLAKKYKEKINTTSGLKNKEIVVCPTAIALNDVGEVFKKTDIKLGGQNVFWEEAGPYTGEISPAMLVEAGCEYVVIGHSERRKNLLENYEMIHKKIKTVIRTEKLTPIICVGESWEERKTDKRDLVLVDQLQQALSGVDVFGQQQLIVAYEPIWAIGTGTAIESSEAEYAHKIIKLTLNDLFDSRVSTNNFRIIYGGSIGRKNVNEFSGLENMDGLLVGGASLDVNEFFKVAKVILK